MHCSVPIEKEAANTHTHGDHFVSSDRKFPLISHHHEGGEGGTENLQNANQKETATICLLIQSIQYITITKYFLGRPSTILNINGIENQVESYNLIY